MQVIDPFVDLYPKYGQQGPSHFPPATVGTLSCFTIVSAHRVLTEPWLFGGRRPPPSGLAAGPAFRRTGNKRKGRLLGRGSTLMTTLSTRGRLVPGWRGVRKGRGGRWEWCGARRWGSDPSMLLCRTKRRVLSFVYWPFTPLAGLFTAFKLPSCLSWLFELVA